MIITKKKQCRKGMTPGSAPNFFAFSSEHVRYIEGPHRHGRTHVRAAMRGRTANTGGCGSKLLKAFRRSGIRAVHANKPQLPCYGQQSERQK